MQPEIIAIGEPMLEFSAEEAGALSEASRFIVGWGGDTSNFCIAASRAGGRVGYLTRLGDDEFGQSFLTLWQREGIDTSRIVIDPDAFTAAYFIARKGRQHHFTYFRRDSAASRMTPGSLPQDYVRGARLLHVSGISQAISLSACDTVFAAAERLQGLRRRLDAWWALCRTVRGERLARLAGKLDSLSPLGILARGYSICFPVPGRRVVKTAAEVAPGSTVAVRLHRGELDCVVRGVRSAEDAR